MPPPEGDGGKWLPKWGAVGTTSPVVQGPEDTTVIRPIVKPESARARRLRERDERVGWVAGLPKSAAEALKTAMGWQAEIDARGIRQADIARRERITRARVTQIMSLLDLPESLRADLLSGHHGSDLWSIRRALRHVVEG